ncbi:mechanosensitive ion channel, partial [Candidatus Woesearchaeota archaeon]|nr:mechanosensitive ion channel [Candidatus Woesearchaeota archaeon]
SIWQQYVEHTVCEACTMQRVTMAAQLNSTILNRIIEVTEPLYSKVLVAVVLVVLGFIIGKIAGKLIQKILDEIEVNKIVKLTTGLNIKLEQILGATVSYFIYFIFIMWALEQLGLGSMILNIIAGGVIVLIIVAIVLGIKDFIPNLIAGIYILVRGFLKEGEYIKLNSVSGRVTSINLSDTIIETDAKDTVVIPNSMLIREKVIKIKRHKPKGGG